MKTNVPIVLEDEQLNKLACLIASKPVKRTLTRKEIIEICQRHIGGLLEMADPHITPPSPESIGTPGSVERQRASAKAAVFSEMSRIDPHDPLSRTMAKPNDPSYVRGWNQVKRDSERRKA
jgi:hypothetical protein